MLVVVAVMTADFLEEHCYALTVGSGSEGVVQLQLQRNLTCEHFTGKRLSH